MISTEMILDSTNWLGKRISTLKLTYPRYIHSQFMTHRLFSKNSASSRAIPVKTTTRLVQEEMVIPMWTGKQKGMQGKDISSEQLKNVATLKWQQAAGKMIDTVNDLDYLGIHKQNANRLLEPFLPITVICTSTEWENFFTLREDHDAQPEIQQLARSIRKTMAESNPQYLKEGQWHIPLGNKMDWAVLEDMVTEYTDFKNLPKGWDLANEMLILQLKISSARCARISYLTFDGEINHQKDLKLYNDLVTSHPQHLSPTEHQARVPYKHELKHFNCYYRLDKSEGDENDVYTYEKGRYHSNLEGWIQYRKLIENR